MATIPTEGRSSEIAKTRHGLTATRNKDWLLLIQKLIEDSFKNASAPKRLTANDSLIYLIIEVTWITVTNFN